MRVHAARQLQALRHGDELAIHQDLLFGDHAGAADIALAVGVAQEGVQGSGALRQALVQILPFVPGDDARDDVEGDRRFGTLGRAVGTEGDAVPAVEEIDFVSRRRHAFGRGASQPVGDTAIGLSDRTVRAGIHLIEDLGCHPAFHPLSNHLISNRRANKVPL